MVRHSSGQRKVLGSSAALAQVDLQEIYFLPPTLTVGESVDCGGGDASIIVTLVTS